MRIRNDFVYLRDILYEYKYLWVAKICFAFQNSVIWIQILDFKRFITFFDKTTAESNAPSSVIIALHRKMRHRKNYVSWWRRWTSCYFVFWISWICELLSREKDFFDAFSLFYCVLKKIMVQHDLSKQGACTFTLSLQPPDGQHLYRMLLRRYNRVQHERKSPGIRSGRMQV